MTFVIVRCVLFFCVNAIPNGSYNYRIESECCGSGVFELVLASLARKCCI